LLETRGLWAFGPEMNGPNVLINDTLPEETNQDFLADVKDSIV